MTDPVSLFKIDRDRARAANDPMANLLTLGHNGDQTAEMRTLVLRDVGNELAIFINATSPKWPNLDKHASFLTYWPSVQIQYRILADVSPVLSDTVSASWQLRPDAPKRMDWFYTQVTHQSHPVGTRDALLQQVNALELPDNLVAPDTARGLLLKPYRLERLDLTQENGIHDRTLFQRDGDTWTVQTLVP
jgi:pyridoxine/pyridoxamine 5'-phosphate oxidase